MLNNWKTFLHKLLSRIWIPLLVVVAGLVAWQLFRITPIWLEDKVTRSFGQENIVVTDFPIEQIGFSSTTVGEGSLLYGPGSLRWDRIKVNYRLNDLFAGRVNSISVESPNLSFNWSPPFLQVDQEDTRQQSSFQSSGEPSEVPAIEKILSGEPGLPDQQDQPTLWQTLQQLPFRTLSLTDGAINFQLHEETQFSGKFEGRVGSQPFGTSGDLFFDSSFLTTHLSMRSPVAEELITLQAGISMPYNSIREVGNRLLDRLELDGNLPRITSSGKLTVDLFAERASDQPVYASAEASLDELTLNLPSPAMEVTLDDFMAAGYARVDDINMEGGTDVLIPSGQDYFVDPFGLRISLKKSTRLTVETEMFNFGYRDFQGRCAILGRADLGAYPGPGWARLEASFSKMGNGGVSFDPFSLLVSQTEKGYELQASELGLNKAGTLWIEGLKAFFDPGKSLGEGSFNWFGLAGEALGSCVVKFTSQNEIGNYELFLNDASGSQKLKASLTEAGGKYAMEMSGILSLPWVNALCKWLGYTGYTFAGAGPQIKTELDLQFPLLSGYADLVLAGLDIGMGSGAKISGISGNHKFAVMVMPRSLGKQETRIKSLVSGPLKFEDIYLEWELKTIRELVVSRFKANIGSGIIELKPFTIDPLQPELKTTIVIRKFDADLLRQWLKEDRFTINAEIVGQIPVGWKNGELIFGTGKFSLDKESVNNRLKFQNRQFLQEKFSSIGGVPPDIKERLLNALWSNGISVNSMDVYLGPTEKDGQLSFRIAVNGGTGNNMIEFPIGRFVLNNLISVEDLAVLLNMVAPIRIDPTLGSD